jgi:hypothetical protein
MCRLSGEENHQLTLAGFEDHFSALIGSENSLLYSIFFNSLQVGRYDAF